MLECKYKNLFSFLHVTKQPQLQLSFPCRFLHLHLHAGNSGNQLEIWSYDRVCCSPTEYPSWSSPRTTSCGTFSLMFTNFTRQLTSGRSTAAVTRFSLPLSTHEPSANVTQLERRIHRNTQGVVQNFPNDSRDSDFHEIRIRTRNNVVPFVVSRGSASCEKQRRDFLLFPEKTFFPDLGNYPDICQVGSHCWNIQSCAATFYTQLRDINRTFSYITRRARLLLCIFAGRDELEIYRSSRGSTTRLTQD